MDVTTLPHLNQTSSSKSQSVNNFGEYLRLSGYGFQILSKILGDAYWTFITPIVLICKILVFLSVLTTFLVTSSRRLRSEYILMSRC